MSLAPRIFEPEYYARLADIEERHWWSLGMRVIATRLLDRFAPAKRDWHVLDAGCGAGLTLNWVKRYTDIEPVGLDYAREALEFCARRDHRQILAGTTLQLPFPCNHFNLVVSSDVLQHLPRPDGDRQALTEIARVLQAGGLFLLRTNSHCGYPPSSDVDYQRYDLGEIRTCVQAAGFRIHTATYVNFVPGLFETVRRKVTRENHVGGYTGLTLTARPPSTNLITEFFYGTLLLESLYLAQGNRSLNFGHSIIILAEKNHA